MTSFNENEIPEDIKYRVDRSSQIRCQHYNEKKHGICNKMFFVGKPSDEPQEFKCPNCGNKTIVVKA